MKRILLISIFSVSAFSFLIAQPPATSNKPVTVDANGNWLPAAVNGNAPSLPQGTSIKGLTGATTPTRYVGGTASVAPTTGTFVIGDFVVTQTGKIYVCTASGSPGSWTQAGGGGSGLSGGVAGDVITASGATTIQDSGVALTDVARKSLSLSQFTGTNLNQITTRNFSDLQNIPYRVNNATVFNVKDYGAVGDGTTDDSTAVINAITAAYNANGGVVHFPAGTYRINSQLAIPNDGASPPKQPTIILRGDGAMWDAPLTASGSPGIAVGGTTLDLRYAGSVARIDTRGKGLLQIENLAIADLGTTSTTAFIQTTNTTLHLKHLSFWGASNQGGTAGAVDAIVLGGTSLTIDGGSNSPFQGYGTMGEDINFVRIRRGIYGRTYCNSTYWRGLTFSVSCGGTTAGAIEFDGTVGGAESNVVEGSIIEVTNYTYGMVLKNSKDNAFHGVTFWDGTARVLLSGASGGSSGNSFLGCKFDNNVANPITDSTSGTNWYTGYFPNHTYIGSQGYQLEIAADGGKITHPVFETLQSYQPYYGSNANANTFAIEPGALASDLWLKTPGGAAHSPWIEGRDDQLLFWLGANEKARIQNGFSVGTTNDPGTGVIDVAIGYRIGNAAAAGHYLRGNGTNYLDSAIQAGDIPNNAANTTGSAASLTTTRTIWGQNFNGSANVTGNLSSVGNITGSGAINIVPGSNSTTAVGIFKADGTTNVLDVDTTNARIGINKTPGAFDLDVNGAVNFGGNLTVGGTGTNTLAGSTGSLTAIGGKFTVDNTGYGTLASGLTLGSTGVAGYLQINAVSGTNAEYLSTSTFGSTFQLATGKSGSGTQREFRIGTAGSAALTFMTNNGTKFQIDSSGNFTAVNDNSNSIGDATHRPSLIYVGTGASVIGGTLSVTGASTLTGGIIDGVQALSGAGAVNVTTGATAFTSTGSAQALTLADGTNGQIKTIAHVSDGGSGVLTPTTKSGYSTITFTNVGDAVTLQFFTTAGWIIIGQNGVTVAP